jgi:hypothetical protein
MNCRRAGAVPHHPAHQHRGQPAAGHAAQLQPAAPRHVSAVTAGCAVLSRRCRGPAWRCCSVRRLMLLHLLPDLPAPQRPLHCLNPLAANRFSSLPFPLLSEQVHAGPAVQPGRARRGSHHLKPPARLKLRPGRKVWPGPAGSLGAPLSPTTDPTYCRTCELHTELATLNPTQPTLP